MWVFEAEFLQYSLSYVLVVGFLTNVTVINASFHIEGEERICGGHCGFYFSDVAYGVLIPFVFFASDPLLKNYKPVFDSVKRKFPFSTLRIFQYNSNTIILDKVYKKIPHRGAMEY